MTEDEAINVALCKAIDVTVAEWDAEPESEFAVAWSNWVSVWRNLLKQRTGTTRTPMEAALADCEPSNIAKLLAQHTGEGR